MTRLARLCRAVGVGLAVATATLSMTQVAQAQPAAPAVPPQLVPTTGKVFLVGHAKGVQIYTCSAQGWGRSTPRADLVDDAGKLIMKHYGGPTWEATADRSAIALIPGTPVISVASPAPGPAIPWLRLDTRDVPDSPAGLLTGTTSIQRVETKGGTAPPNAACKTETLGKVVEVPYKADYYFWK